MHSDTAPRAGDIAQVRHRQVLGVRLSHAEGRWTAECFHPDGKAVERRVDLGEGHTAELGLTAYGWSDVQVPGYCGATAAQLEAFEDDVLDRLFDLNERRAREEARLGASSAPARKPRAKKSA